MFPWDRELYHECRKIKLGEVDLKNDPFAILADRLSHEMQLSIIKVTLGIPKTYAIRRNPSPCALPACFRLMVATWKDRQALVKWEKGMHRFLWRDALLKLYNELALTHSELKAVDDKVIIQVEVFSSWAINEAVWNFAEFEKARVVEEFKRDRLAAIVASDQGLVLLFEKDTDIPRSEPSGAGASIAIRCRELIAKYDEFQYTKTEPVSITYSSKETVVRNKGDLSRLTHGYFGAGS